MSSTRAEELKKQGNVCFQSGDFVGADKFYTQAIIQDSSNAAFFTNRALARLKMDQYEAVIDDCNKAIELMPSSMKAYTYIGQAHLRLNHPNDALTSSLRAYELALAQGSHSAQMIANTCLEAKKLRWESLERQRILHESSLLKETCDLISAEAWREAERIRAEKGAAAEEDAKQVLEEAEQKRRNLEEIFGKAEAEKLQKREVPDWLIDNITFSIMLDPVTTKHGHSYDRVTLLDHLRRSNTDPLTREPLYPSDLRPNIALKQACDAFLKENGWAVDW